MTRSGSVQQPPTLDAKGLRKFGLVVGATLIGLFGVVLPFFKHRAWPTWPWVPGGLLCLMAVVAPTSLRGFYRVWTRLGMVLGWINTRIILTLVFALIITPLGLLLRLLGKDPMGRRVDRKVTSFRVASPPTERKQIERPF